MSSFSLPQRKSSSNPLDMEMSESEVRIGMHDNIPIQNNNSDVCSEWADRVTGKDTTGRYHRQRHIEKVPPLLLKGEKGKRNQHHYAPAVVSLGPYHHNARAELAKAEMYKLISLEEFRLSCPGKTTTNILYNEVFEVVQDARKCYIDGSTDKYKDEEFAQIMLRDACFVLFYIESISTGNLSKLMLNNEHLGALGFAHVTRDIFLLENQIPFVVLEVLLNVKFPDDKGEEILNKFFNYLNSGEVKFRSNEKVLENEQPIHLLELYRSYFIALPANDTIPDDNNYVKRNRSFASVTELKDKGVFLKRSPRESANEGIKFHSHCCYGELEIVPRAMSNNTKAILLNLIAYEMCPHSPNDFRVVTYIRVMKSLVVHQDDVMELRNNNILLHSLGRDEEVVKMLDDIEAPAVNAYMFSQLRKEIEDHCNTKYKTWVAELITLYFSSPWKTVALVVASAILFTTFLQTYFSIRPLDDSNGEVMRLLKRCVFNPPSKTA